MNTPLKPCPCGETPTHLDIVETDSKYFRCFGNCCNEWEVEFMSNYCRGDSKEAQKLAANGWNKAPRGINQCQS